MFLPQLKKLHGRKYKGLFLPKLFPFFSGGSRNPAFFTLSYAGEVRVARVQKNPEGYILTNAAWLAIPPEFFREGEIKDHEGMVFFIRELLKRAGIENSPPLVSVIPEERFFQRVIAVDVALSQDPEMLKEKIGTILPLPAEEMIYETKELKPFAAPDLAHSDISIFAASRQYLLTHAKLISDAKLFLVDFIPESFGIFEMARRSIKTDEAVLIIFLAKARALFWIHAANATHFSAAFPYGTDSFGFQEKLDAVITEIREALRFYRDREFHEHGASSIVNRAIIMGEDAPQFDDILSMNIQLHIERPDVLQDVAVSKPEIEVILSENKAKLLPLIGAAKMFLSDRK